MFNCSWLELFYIELLLYNSVLIEIGNFMGLKCVGASTNLISVMKWKKMIHKPNLLDLDKKLSLVWFGFLNWRFSLRFRVLACR